MPDCLHEVFIPGAVGVPGGWTCADCGEVWQAMDPRFDGLQDRINAALDEAAKPTLF